MTTAKPKPVALLEPPTKPRFPDFPPRDDMQNNKILYQHGTPAGVAPSPGFAS